MGYQRFAVSIILGSAVVLGLSLVISVFVTVSIFFIPSLSVSAGILYYVGVATFIASMAVYFFVKIIIFEKVLRVSTQHLYRNKLSVMSTIALYLSLGISIFISFYFRDVIVDIYHPAGGDPRIAVSWMLGTIFLVRIFFLIAAYNECDGSGDRFARNSGDNTGVR